MNRLIVLHTYVLYHTIFILDIKVSITLLRFAIYTCRNLVYLDSELKIFFKEKNPNEIHLLSRGFVFLQKFMIKYKSSMFQRCMDLAW